MFVFFFKCLNGTEKCWVAGDVFDVFSRGHVEKMPFLNTSGMRAGHSCDELVGAQQHWRGEQIHTDDLPCCDLAFQERKESWAPQNQECYRRSSWGDTRTCDDPKLCTFLSWSYSSYHWSHLHWHPTCCENQSSWRIAHINMRMFHSALLSAHQHKVIDFVLPANAWLADKLVMSLKLWMSMWIVTSWSSRLRNFHEFPL